MKKQLIYILGTLLLLLAACTKEDATVNPDKVKGSAPDVKTADENSNEKVDRTVESEKDENERFAEEVTEPLYELNRETYAIEPIGDANPKVVLLTIDDAPDKQALEMARTLKELEAPAIFFVNGHFLATDEKKTVLKEIHDMGFMIGNHTKTHANLKAISVEQQKEEILTVNDTVEEVIGERPVFFRAPFGVNTDFSKTLAEQDGMLLMNWSFGYDWEKKYMDADALADIMVNTEFLRDGANLLMHDREWTAEALEKIVVGLRGKGYELVDPSTIKVAGE
ncbi:MAG: polysaccharide deacetylase family protein [Sporosarcina sp.]